ncbi:MAG: DUF5695 domain-containing protein [Verrucomicrobiota bacterium]
MPKNIRWVFCLCVIGLLFTSSRLAEAQRRGGGGPPTLGLTNGYIELETPDFKIKLVKDSQTLAALQPKNADGFDFTPADQLQARQANRFYHIGDLTFRLRTNQAEAWANYSTAAARQPVAALPVTAPALAAADVSATLPDACPFQVIRTWTVEKDRLVLRFDVKNKLDVPVEIGALGIPLIFNNNAGYNGNKGRVQSMSAFSDPAIGLDGGYVQVTRLNGHGPALVVVPAGKTPLEAYEPLQSDKIGDLTPTTQTFEAFYEWMAHSAAYAENEWKTEGDRWVNTHGMSADYAATDWKTLKPWNTPTSETLAPGATRTFGLGFLVAPEIRDITKTLIANNRPAALGIPGYILPMGMDGRLFLKYSKDVKSIAAEPAGAIEVQNNGPAKDGWAGYTLHGKTWGRCNLRIEYGDGLVQTISYDVIKPEAQALADMGHFLFTKDWYTDTNDPFHRAPSVMTYDRGHDRIVLQDSLTWKAGLQDEGGSGGWVSACMKEFGEPDKAEVEKEEQFIDGVLWGGIQYKDGPRKYTVVNSMFYYQPDEITNYYTNRFSTTDWTKWNKQRALTGGQDRPRAYNYPHVVAAYWSLYRLARNHPGLVTHRPWDWYLDQAYQTVYSLTHGPVGYLDVGLMEGDVFVLLLQDLKREGWTEKADELEKAMKVRADRWNTEPYPFGSEQAWDSTGQPEVYAWTEYFGYHEKAQVCLDSILGYMPAVPSWAYNGNARRYWDFYYGAAPPGQQERQIHHYGSGINAVPVLSAFRTHPEDLHLLYVGYGGLMGALACIDQDGFPSAAFHANPAILKWDTYTGDCGPNLFSLAINTGTYLVNHPDFGWQAFGGSLKTSGDWVTVTPLDAFRMRFYAAPLGLWLTLDAGAFESVSVNTKTHAVRTELSPADPFTPLARLRLEQPAKVAGVAGFHPAGGLAPAQERGAWVIPLSARPTQVDLNDLPVR